MDPPVRHVSGLIIPTFCCVFFVSTPLFQRRCGRACKWRELRLVLWVLSARGVPELTYRRGSAGQGVGDRLRQLGSLAQDVRRRMEVSKQNMRLAGQLIWFGGGMIFARI